MSELDSQIVRGSAWLALSYGGSQLVPLLTAATLAHFIAPSAFGLVALSSILIAVTSTLQESGLGLAIIHRRTDVEEAAGTTLVYAVALSVILYGCAVLVSPLFAHLFRQPDLKGVIIVLSIVLIPRGIGMVPGVLIERELKFGARAKGELSGAVVQALVAIPLAIAGAGVWSLVAGQLAAASVTSLIYWIVAPFRPSPRLFSWRLLRELARYGRYVTTANVLALIDQNVDTGTVGRVLGSADVGFYNLAWRLANLPATGVGYVIGRVMFPAYATLQHDKETFRRLFLVNVRRVALVSLPVGLGILLAARPIVVAVFGAKWSPAVPPLQILAVFAIVRSFAGTTGAVFQAAGRPQVIVWLNVWHLSVLVAGLLALTPSHGIKGAAVAVVIAAVASLLPAYRVALRVLELPFRELVVNLERPLACSLPLVAVLGIVDVSTSGLSSGVRLIVLVVSGTIVYAASLASLARAEVQSIRAAFRSSSA